RMLRALHPGDAAVGSERSIDLETRWDRLRILLLRALEQPRRLVEPASRGELRRGQAVLVLHLRVGAVREEELDRLDRALRVARQEQERGIAILVEGSREPGIGAQHLAQALDVSGDGEAPGVAAARAQELDHAQLLAPHRAPERRRAVVLLDGIDL